MVEDLIKRRDAITPEPVADVFLRWFGPESGRLTPDQAGRISEGMNAAALCTSKGKGPTAAALTCAGPRANLGRSPAPGRIELLRPLARVTVRGADGGGATVWSPDH